MIRNRKRFNSPSELSFVSHRKSALGVPTFMVAACAFAPFDARAATPEELFTQTCNACHTIGEGPRVGPDLKGVTERRPMDWLLKFVKSPQAVINSGDPIAVELFNKWNKIPMPDPPYSEDEIKSILAFIQQRSSGAVAAAAPPAPPPRVATPDDIKRGQELFQGVRRFANRGAACNSCHEVANDAVIGGGVLAKDLTSVFGRIGGAGVQAVLGSPPFPVMQEAYKGAAKLTEDEAFALIAFLQDADKNKAFHQPRDYGTGLVLAGCCGSAILMGLYSAIWRRRKKGPVNQDIFDRQVKSEG